MTTSLFVGLVLVVGAPAPKKADEDAAGKIEGQWRLESIEGAKDQPPENVYFFFVDGKMSVKDGSREVDETGTYTVDMTTKIATIDIRPTRGEKEKVVLGIFEVKGDKLQLCFGKDAERPTEFKSVEGKRIMLFTMKRVKAEK